MASSVMFRYGPENGSPKTEMSKIFTIFAIENAATAAASPNGIERLSMAFSNVKVTGTKRQGAEVQNFHRHLAAPCRLVSASTDLLAGIGRDSPEALRSLG